MQCAHFLHITIKPFLSEGASDTEMESECSVYTDRGPLAQNLGKSLKNTYASLAKYEKITENHTLLNSGSTRSRHKGSE